MSLTSIILLLISAFTHAGWNLVSKKQHPTAAFFLIANTIGVIFLLPILVFYRDKIQMVPMPVWICVALSGFFLASYMTTLAGAYRGGDMSIVYPLVRSTPAIFVIIITIFIGKYQEIGWLCIFGVALIVTGGFILPTRTFCVFSIKNYLSLCYLLAVLSAVGTACYTVVDDEALRRLRDLSVNGFNPINATFIYLVLEGISTSLWMVVYILPGKRERKSFFMVLRFLKGKATMTGIGIYITYGLVLASMNFVRNVSYVAAFRQLSIPIGAIFGIVLLKEPFYKQKIIGVSLVFMGSFLVGIG